MLAPRFKEFISAMERAGVCTTAQGDAMRRDINNLMQLEQMRANEAYNLRPKRKWWHL